PQPLCIFHFSFLTLHSPPPPSALSVPHPASRYAPCLIPHAEGLPHFNAAPNPVISSYIQPARALSCLIVLFSHLKFQKLVVVGGGPPPTPTKAMRKHSDSRIKMCENAVIPASKCAKKWSSPHALRQPELLNFNPSTHGLPFFTRENSEK